MIYIVVVVVVVVGWLGPESKPMRDAQARPEPSPCPSGMGAHQHLKKVDGHKWAAHCSTVNLLGGHGPLLYWRAWARAPDMTTRKQNFIFTHPGSSFAARSAVKLTFLINTK